MDNTIKNFNTDSEINFNVGRPKYILQEPRVDNDGIWIPYEAYVPEGYVSNYKLLISKDIFIEAYNKWIKGE